MISRLVREFFNELKPYLLFFQDPSFAFSYPSHLLFTEELKIINYRHAKY
jgi:hypothetical protein